MEEENVQKKAISPSQKRRSFFKTVLAASAIPAIGIARIEKVKSPISWVHGNSATIVGVHHLEMDTVQGSARVVRGRSWSTVPLHFSIPSPGIDSGTSMAISAIWVRLQADKGAKISGIALYDCEMTLAKLEGMNLCQQTWDDIRIPLRSPCNVIRSIGVTLDCEFADVSRQISISAVGCEFNIVA